MIQNGLTCFAISLLLVLAKKRTPSPPVANIHAQNPISNPIGRGVDSFFNAHPGEKCSTFSPDALPFPQQPMSWRGFEEPENHALFPRKSLRHPCHDSAVLFYHSKVCLT